MDNRSSARRGFWRCQNCKTLNNAGLVACKKCNNQRFGTKEAK